MGFRVAISTEDAFPPQSSKDELIWAIVLSVASTSKDYEQRLEEAAKDENDDLKEMLLAYVSIQPTLLLAHFIPFRVCLRLGELLLSSEAKSNPRPAF